MAAVFTDPTRVPSDVLSKILVALSGASLLFIVAYAAQEVPPYGNLLTSIARGAGFSAISSSRKARPPEVFARGVTQHARVVIVALGCAWLFLSIFALVKLWTPASANVDAALLNMKAVLSKETGLDPQSIPLDRLEIDGADYVGIYRAGTDKITVRATRDDGKIRQIIRERPPPSSLSKP